MHLESQAFSETRLTNALRASSMRAAMVDLVLSLEYQLVYQPITSTIALKFYVEVTVKQRLHKTVTIAVSICQDLLYHRCSLFNQSQTLRSTEIEWSSETSESLSNCVVNIVLLETFMR